MAKPKPNLAGVLDDLPPAPVVRVVRPARRSRPETPAEGLEPTVMVGANLPPKYARNLAFLHAETGKSKKELLTEALDMLFVAKGAEHQDIALQPCKAIGACSLAVRQAPLQTEYR